MRYRWLSNIAIGSVVACSSGPPIQVAAPPPVQAPPAPKPAPVVKTMVLATATATIRDLAGAQVGSATFTDTFNGLLISGTISGLGLGAHGVHIHAVGKCDSPFTTAGPHFDPMKKKHGFRIREGPHMGDLPNIDMPAAGTLKFEFLLKGVTVNGPNALLTGDGASIVFHSGRDDFLTDPDGASGARLACGVIQKR
jgi:superoxide dismutase, Cu-Zn family